ncbi:MAG TPA: acyl-CoA dehydrogenase [Burkholderiales bacterium]|nr:acyl-CoA dehydrogenase [Burkholderiales bacterium]
MSTYSAPIKDMRFVIEKLIGLDAIAALPGGGDVNAELLVTILEEAAKFAAEVLDPLNVTGDRQGARFTDGDVTAPDGFAQAYRQFIEGGWNGVSGQPEFGGQGLPYIIATAVHEMWNSANMAFCLCPMLTSGVLEALRIHGTPQQRSAYLPHLTSGEWTGTMNLTEPQAGSDLSAVRTRAEPEGDHYRIRGTKIFITWGEHDMAENIIHLVLARTPDAPEGVKGISLFIVPKYLVAADGRRGARNDVKCVSIEHKLGIHASPTAVLAYGDGEGAIGYLVGEENRGLQYMFTMMNQARLGVGVEGVALAERAYQHALEYAKTRVQGRAIGQQSGDRVTIIHHPDVRRMLMSMKARTEAMRALAYVAAAALDAARRHPDDGERRRNQARVDLLTPVVKGWCTEQCVEIASTGIQVHGGMGFIEETGAAQFLRDARITTIYEGTTGIQAGDLIGRKLALEKGAAAYAVITEMEAVVDELVARPQSEFAAIRAALNGGIAALRAATDWVIETHPRDPQATAAASVPYLKLFGCVAGGWQMARAALRAQTMSDAGDGDDDFLSAKKLSARFYADHILPRAAAHAHAVIYGTDSVLASAEASF